MRACQVEYHRWCTGEISSRDLVDKWGGDVLRTFQAWYMQGRTREDVEGRHMEGPEGAALPATTLPDEDSTVPYDVLQTDAQRDECPAGVMADLADESLIRRRRHEASVAKSHRRRRDGVRRLAHDD